MDVNIVTSLVGAGLEREYLLLKDLLNANDIYVVGVHYTNVNAPLTRADITLFLEVVMPQALCLSRENWLAPNSEWWDPKNDRFLPQFTKIICKTKDCYDIWCQKVGKEKCVYTSFEARDIYNPEIAREVKFLHVAGKSEHKNTDSVCKAWRMSRLAHITPLPHLTIVARAPVFMNDHFRPDNPFPDNNVTHIEKATDAQILELMNSHRFHIIPSMYEGFGHSIHEALGCGGLVLTTDAPPMSTFSGILKEASVPSHTHVPRSLARLNQVTPDAVNAAVRKAAGIGWCDPIKTNDLSAQARVAFLENRSFFRQTFMGLINAIR